MPNECGECTMCCRLPAVSSLDKPVNQWCKHAQPGRGCKAYGERPIACQTYRCAYLQADNMPLAMRPDKCGAIFEGTRDPGVVILRVRPEGFATTWRHVGVRTMVLSLLRIGTRVVMTDGVRSRMFSKANCAPGKWALLEGTRDLSRDPTPEETALTIRHYVYKGAVEEGFL